MFQFRKSKFLLGLLSGFLISWCWFFIISYVDNFSFSNVDVLEQWSWDQLNIDDTAKALQELYSEISSQYYDTGSIDQTKMSRQALASFVNALWDPFSSYLEPTENKEFQDTMNGHETIEWIGAILSKKDNGAMIEEIVKSSPAAQVWLKPLDIIIKVDWEIIQDMSLQEIIDKIRGERWTSVNLLVAREQSWSAVQFLEKKVVRDTIIIPSVTSKILSWWWNMNIWYISLSLFVEDTNEKLTEALEEFKKNNISGLILDLRWNWGWLLPESVSVASRFLPESTPIVQVKYRTFQDYLYKAEWKDIVSDMPLVILVDEYTASASEIISLAIREWRCKGSSVTSFTKDCDVLLVWHTTFGKWSIQSLHDLQFGWSLKLTIWKRFSPSGLSIDKIWITPDIILDFDGDAYKASGKDNYIEKAKSLFSQK